MFCSVYAGIFGASNLQTLPYIRNRVSKVELA